MTAVMNYKVSSNAFHLQQKKTFWFTAKDYGGSIKKVEDEDKHNIKDH